jgi:hypothetical protein
VHVVSLQKGRCHSETERGLSAGNVGSWGRKGRSSRRGLKVILITKLMYPGSTRLLSDSDTLMRSGKPQIWKASKIWKASYTVVGVNTLGFSFFLSTCLFDFPKRGSGKKQEDYPDLISKDHQPSRSGFLH